MNIPSNISPYSMNLIKKIMNESSETTNKLVSDNLKKQYEVTPLEKCSQRDIELINFYSNLYASKQYRINNIIITDKYLPTRLSSLVDGTNNPITIEDIENEREILEFNKTPLCSSPLCYGIKETMNEFSKDFKPKTLQDLIKERNELLQ
jgi:hypothetical protein